MGKTFLCFIGAFVVAVSGQAIIDPALKSKFFGIGNGGGSGQNVMVSFAQSMDSVFSKIDAMNFTSMLAKRNALTDLQQTFSDASQAALKGFLATQGVNNFQSFWINNKVVVPNASPGLITAMSFVPGVSKIEPEPQAEILLPHEIPEPEYLNLTRLARQNSVEWGIRMIRADSVWGSYKGRGIVVANIDTGVRYTHETLRGRWRNSYGWLDPYQRTSTPNDQNGHGTHTMGTIAGTNGIGVAPEATWIACKGCSARTCGGNELMRCGQWIQCPTRPDGSGKDCSKAPHIVSNSWGGGRGETWYDEIIRSWREAGIIPVVSIGNSGSSCDTANSPGDRPNVIGVGSTDSSERISSFSSRGPTTDGRVKPDISAPGSNVRSAWYSADNAYNTISGTSMACPHVSGVIALMKQKNPGINYDQIYNAITQKAARSSLNTGSAQSCGGVRSDSWPNNAFGYGRIDTPDSLNAI